MIQDRLLSRPPWLSWVFLLPTAPKETSFNKIVRPFRPGTSSEAAPALALDARNSAQGTSTRMPLTAINGMRLNFAATTRRR
jgi:hypothetical protein